jgi:F-type H+-transporting ATPase subunit b
VNINETLIGQMITFALFVWFSMKFVWPPLQANLKARQDKIAEGLQAAERGHKELELAQKFAVKQIQETKLKAHDILEQARKQAVRVIEEARKEANEVRQKIIQQAQEEVEKERCLIKTQLKKEVIELTTLSTEKLLKHAINEADQKRLLNLGDDLV